MTAAGTFDTHRQATSPHWCRTVYLRQGRFFVVSVTTRTQNALPSRGMCLKVYTTGRFTVREELHWMQPTPTRAPLGEESKQSRLEAAWPKTAVQQQRLQPPPSLQQQQEQQQQEQKEEAEATPTVGQQQEHPEQQVVRAQCKDGPAGYVWAKGIVRAKPLRQHTSHPAACCAVLDGHTSVSISCLAWGPWAALRSTLAKVLAAFRHRWQQQAPTDSQLPATAAVNQAACGASAGQLDSLGEGACRAAGEKLAPGGGQQPPPVHIDVIGYSWGMDMLAPDVPV